MSIRLLKSPAYNHNVFKEEKEKLSLDYQKKELRMDHQQLRKRVQNSSLNDVFWKFIH